MLAFAKDRSLLYWRPAGSPPSHCAHDLTNEGSGIVNSYDVVVIGAGVIGSSVAFQLSKLGAKNVLVLDRGTIGAGTTSQSSGILRTHYSVKENVELARKS